jgi:predicted nucleic acid-binding protein
VTRYCDTDVLLKLYTVEEGADKVRAWVVRCGEPLVFTPLHRSECVSALRLKAFRRECRLEQSTAALAALDDDVDSGVLRPTALDWDAVWERAEKLARAHAASTGCRTLDTLHVASALQLEAQVMVTRDQRQASLAKLAGLRVVNPLK